MIEWFDDVCVGMRFKTGQKVVMREDIKRFAAEFDQFEEPAVECAPVGIRVWCAVRVGQVAHRLDDGVHVVEGKDCVIVAAAPAFFQCLRCDVCGFDRFA